MAFNSYIFILCLLPVTILLYYLLNRFEKYPFSKLMLIIASFIFVAHASWFSVGFLVCSMALTYACVLGQRKFTEKTTLAKLFTGIGIAGNILILGYFKYTYFIVGNLNQYCNAGITLKEIIVPLGISFITFQQIAFLMDCYRKTIEKPVLLDYVFYITFFPKFVQGPITKYNDLVGSINDSISKKFNPDNLSEGLWHFANGLARKVLLADVLAKAVSWGYGTSLGHMTAMDALLVSLCFTFQIYFDFSGYSHMAIGVAKMLNLRLADNFDTPYASKSILEFWKKWHISLTDFFREYLYFPLGGSRKGKIRTYLNTMFIYLVSGLWHGAAWTYVVWGGLHGLACCLNRIFRKQWEKCNDILRWILTFGFVNITWIFFRALSVPQAFEYIQKMFRMENTMINDGLIACFRIPEITFLAGKFPAIATFITTHRGIEVIAFLALSLFLSLNGKDKYNGTFKPSFGKSILTILFLTWSVVSLSTVVQFVYGSF